MMKVLLVKFCDYACRVDGAKGSLIGIFDTLGGVDYPLTHPSFYIAVEFEFDMWEGGQDSGIKLVLIDEDGKELMGLEGDFVIPKPVNNVPVTMFEYFRIDNLSFEKPGAYRLDVLRNGDPIAEARLLLVQGPPPGV